MLEVTGLFKRFGGFTAVNDVSFALGEGEILGLIGPNGSGKSTIFNLLSGTLAPTAGSIRFQGREIAGRPPHRIINQGIGRTFQIPRPFRRLSLFDNVMLAGYFGQGRHSRAHAAEAAERALDLVGLPSDRAAPVIVQQVFALIERIRANGLTVLIVEQNVRQVLRVVDRAYLLEAGTIRASGSAGELLASEAIQEAYLGV